MLKQLLILENKSNSEFTKEAENLGIKIYKSHTIVDTEGYKRINKITIMELSKDGQSFTSSKKLN